VQGCIKLPAEAIVALAFLPAVSPTFSRQTLEVARGVGLCHTRRSENLRNGRLESLRYEPRRIELDAPLNEVGGNAYFLVFRGGGVYRLAVTSNEQQVCA
jgi:hypothetical protein